MQALLSSKCRYCDITLEGREQFVGHTIHSHEIPFEQAEAMWKLAISYILHGGD